MWEPSDDDLVGDDVRVEEGPTGDDGSRPVRVHAAGGPIALRYAARVAVDGSDRIGRARPTTVRFAGLAPVETLVRIACGRGAAEIAWASSSGSLLLDDVEVSAIHENP